jgi:hypothetical protein
MKNFPEFFEGEMSRLNAALQKLSVNDWTPLHRLREEMHLVRQAQQRVHEQVKAHPFGTEAEEIAYHKELYPQLRALHIFRVEVYLLLKDVPPLGKKRKKTYYLEQMDHLFAYVRRYEFLYTYFKLKADDLDQLLFTDKGNRQSVLLPILADPEITHTTETGYLFARFIAYEQLFRYVLHLLEGKQTPFQWTGPVIHLIELAHGIHLNEQVNHGQTGIVEFFQGLGDYFGVDLGVPKKGFEALHARKTMSKTHFSDRIRDSLIAKMDEEDDLKRQKRQKARPGF